MTSLVVCSKSAWIPSMRREHALTLAAAERGIDVVFIESPADVRSVRNGSATEFARGFVGHSDDNAHDGLRVVHRSTPAPGHRGRISEAVDVALLRRIIGTTSDTDSPLVCNLPWQWAATASGRHRRVFDCADDWTQLFPSSRTRRLTEHFARIAVEADEVIVASPDLAPLFPGRDVVVVPNGADASAIPSAVNPPPGRNTMVYVGTFSERFDAPLVAELLRALPDWRLDLYGPCGYAGRGDRPAPELSSLLAEFEDRVRWHGTISRAEVPAAIDAGDVVIVPNRIRMSHGQSSMKLFDGAARGRPAVVALGVETGASESPPGTYVAANTGEWVDAVRAASTEDASLIEARIAWARSNTWSERWPAWSAGVFGPSSATSAPS